MFSKKDFQDWAKQSVVPFAAVMTKIDGREHDELLRTYGFRGFPSMAILDAEGEAITKEVPRDLFSMQNIVAAAPSYVKLAAAVEDGDTVDEKAWFMAQLGMGKLDAATAKAKMADLELEDPQLPKAEQMVFVLEMSELWMKARGRGATEEDKTSACQAVYDAFKAGKRLPSGASPEGFVDEMLIDAAKSNNDAKAFFHAYDRVRQGLIERIEQMKGFMPRYEADLEKNKDDEKMVERITSAKERLLKSIESTEQQVEELAVLAKKLKG